MTQPILIAVLENGVWEPMILIFNLLDKLHLWLRRALRVLLKAWVFGLDTCNWFPCWFDFFCGSPGVSRRFTGIKLWILASGFFLLNGTLCLFEYSFGYVTLRELSLGWTLFDLLIKVLTFDCLNRDSGSSSPISALRESGIARLIITCEVRSTYFLAEFNRLESLWG